MTNATAIADVANLLDFYDNREDEEWARHGMRWVRTILGRTIAAMFYHPITLHLAGEKYTPDWMCIFVDGRIAFIEINSGQKQKPNRDTCSKLRAAAALFPCFWFYEAVITLDRGPLAECRIEAIAETT